MSFLAPIMLWGSVAAGIPIALHFFFRSRYRTVPWAAMKFLLASIEQTSRRMKFQELLLLVLHVTLLVLLALAMARPLSSVVRGAGQGAAVDTVFLFDTSMSMGANDGGSSRLQRAQDAALSILEQLPPHSTVQIITCADRAEIEEGRGGEREKGKKGEEQQSSSPPLPFSPSPPLAFFPSVLGLLGPRSPGNLDQARVIIKDLKPTSLATDLRDGIFLASAAVSRAQNGNKELYVFTDMQKSGWDTRPAEVKTMMAEIGAQASITMVRCGQRDLTNAAIIGVVPQTAVPRPGERVDFAVEVSHTSGKEPIRDLQLTLLVNGREVQGEAKSIKLLQKGETQIITMTGKLDKPGLHTITVLMSKDDVPGDNRFDYVVRVPDYYRTLVVDGGTNDPEDKDTAPLASSYYLMHQIAPVKDSDWARFHVQQTRVRARSALPSHLDKLDFCILANCEVPADGQDKGARNVLSPSFLKELALFVKGGGSLLIYAGDRVKSQDYNKVLGELLPLPLKGEAKDFDHNDPEKIDRDTFNLPAYQRFKTDKVFGEFNNIEIYKAFQMEEPTRKEVKKEEENVNVILRYKKTHWPAVVSRKIGDGEVIFVTTSAEPGGENTDKQVQASKDLQFTWNNWAVNPMCTAFVKSTLAHLASGSAQEQNFIAGKTFTWNARKQAGTSFTLYYPKEGAEGREARGESKEDREEKGASRATRHAPLAARLGLPVKDKNTGRLIVQANDLYNAGIYRIRAMDPAEDGKEDETEESTDGKSLPVAVIPDKNETENFQAYEDDAFDEFLGITPPPRHLLAGTSQERTTGVDRLNREWTVWVLWLLLILALCEVALAYWCGRAW